MRRCVGAYVRLSLSQTHAYVWLDVGSETDNCECEFFFIDVRMEVWQGGVPWRGAA